MTTLTLADFDLSPQIVISRDEHRRLLVLAMAGSGHAPDDSDELLYELDRATVVANDDVPSEVVRMGSLVTFRTDSETRTVQLAYPGEADIGRGRVSILTPIGAALIGLHTGQSITWRTRDNRRQALTVLRVVQPSPGAPEPPRAA